MTEEEEQRLEYAIESLDAKIKHLGAVNAALIEIVVGRKLVSAKKLAKLIAVMESRIEIVSKAEKYSRSTVTSGSV